MRFTFMVDSVLSTTGWIYMEFNKHIYVFSGWIVITLVILKGQYEIILLENGGKNIWNYQRYVNI